MIAFAASWALPAAAQVAAAEADGGARVEEIVVTARRTEENLQQVPVAVTAVTAATIATRNLQDVRGLAGATPNLILQPVGRVGAAGQPALYLRGIGLADNVLTADPAVGMYVDGVYLARNIGNILYLGDIKRIEVLRGPQGTLFGKNTIGGAINITTNEPGDQFDAKAELTIGNYNRRAGKLILNVPVSETLALRAAAFGDLQDGYIKLNNYPGKSLGDNNVYGGQVKLRWKPTSDLTVDLGFDHTTIDNTGSPAVLTAVWPQGRVYQIYNQSFSGNPAVCTTAAGQATNRACFGPVQIPTNIHRSNETEYGINGQKDDPYSYNRSWGTNLSVQWDLPIGTLTNIASYRHMYARSTANLGFFEPIYFVGIRNPDRSKQFSEELRLNGKALDDKLSWVAGAYYFRENFKSRNIALTPLAIILPGNPYPLFSDGLFVGKTENLSAFTQFTYAFSDSLRLTGGARYTHETKKVDATITPGTITQFSAKQTAGRLDPMVSLSATFAPDVIGYASYSQGFRSGGFPTRVPGGLNTLPTYGPEKAQAYEVGLKTELFDHRLRFNVAAFRTIYRDIQAAGTSYVFNPPQATTINAGRARIQGVEVELTAQVNRILSFDLSGSYLDAQFTKVDPTANDSGFPITTGSRFAYSPKWKGHAGSTITLPLADGDLVLRGDVDYSSRIYFNLANTIWEGAMAVVNASVAYRFPDKRTEIVVGAKNLTDKTYFTSGVEDRVTQGLTYKNLAQPRTVFATLRWKY